MTNETQQYKLWITKHISGFCATSKMLFYRNQSATPDCPVCKQSGVRDETRHQAVCPDSQRQEIWSNSVSTIDRWLHKVHTHPTLHSAIIKYLLSKDTSTLTTILKDSNISSLLSIGKLCDDDSKVFVREKETYVV